MTAETPQRMPWQRQPGEPQKQYAAFCCYRDLGQGRSLTNAVRHWLTVPCDKQATFRRRQQRRYQAHEKPGGYVHSVRQNWGRFSKRYHWVERVRAYDEYTSAEAEDRALDAQIQRKIEEQREAEEERKRTRTGARTLKLVGQQLAFEVAAALQAGEHKKVLTCEKCGFIMGQDRLQALLPHLAKAATAFDVGAKHERLELEKPTEITEHRGDVDRRKLADLIRRRIPEEQWEEVAAEVDEILNMRTTEAAK